MGETRVNSSNSAIFTRRLALLAATAAGVAAVAYRAADWVHSLEPLGAVILIGGGLGSAFALACLALRAHPTVVKRVVREIVLLGAVLVAAEVWLIHELPDAWTKDKTARNQLVLEQAAHKLEVPFDERTVSEVVEDLRRQGQDALPALSRAWPRTSRLGQLLPAGFYPLSDASNARIVECNENGEYLVFRTDEFGFNNPPGLVASGRIDVAVVGESHALGHCVAPGKGFVDAVRRAFPRTANFALSYTFALSQLGSLREYVEPLKPSLVLWVVNAPMAIRSGGEEENPVLRRYLDPTFSQDLMARQAEVDAIVRRGARAIQAADDRALREELERASTERFSRVYALQQIRSRMDLSKPWQHPPPPPDTALFEQSLRLAESTVKSWGGQLLVMILPTYGDLMGEAQETERHRLVRSVVQKLDIDFFDTSALFRAQPDIRSLYAMRMSNHPNARGHALLGRKVIDEIRKRFAARGDRGTDGNKLWQTGS